MGQASEQRARISPSLMTAALAAVVLEPNHGYEVALWLNARLAPLLQFDRRRVYEALRELEREGFVCSEVVSDSTAPGGFKRVCHATASGTEVCSTWLAEGRLGLAPAQGGLYAWMLLSREQEAPQLLASLAEWQRDCMERAEAKESSVRATSWSGRMAEQHRAAKRMQYKAQIDCIGRIRGEIEEYLDERT